MGYYNEKRKIIETSEKKVVAVATFERGAEIIAKCLNYYFNTIKHTDNEAVQMMHKNTAQALTKIANFIEKNGLTCEVAVEYLREVAEEMSAQAVVVSLRDELKFEKPKDN